MISRIRIEAYGNTPGGVAAALEWATQRFERPEQEGTGTGAMYLPCERGQQVIERQLEEPADSVYAFRGRLILHPELTRQADWPGHETTVPQPSAF